jgi:hypothetical protein
MARSPNVWVVIDSTGLPVAAFTVKYELCVWLFEEENPQSISHLRGWKLKDGVWHHIGKPPPSPLPLDLLFLRSEGEKIVAKRKSGLFDRPWQ